MPRANAKSEVCGATVSWGDAAGSCVCCRRDAPHALQNFAVVRLGARHEAQSSGKATPQASQNLAFSRFSLSQLEHRIISPSRQQHDNSATLAQQSAPSQYSRKAFRGGR